MSHLSVPIHEDIIAEIVIRSEGKAGIARLIESVVGDYLERTRGDASIWSDAHAEAVAEEKEDDTLIRYGAATRGYHWDRVFLPNGTTLKTTYKGKDGFAEVRHQQIYYQDLPCSPSQFASQVANNTSRSAWRDIWVKRPSDRSWVFANMIRTGRAS
jgi:hypothetical protein